MAKMHSTDLGVAGFGTPVASLTASLAVLMALIVSALGIKLWWFKHRLSFNHTATSNSVAGGTQPTANAPTSQDKRTSQQFLDSLEVRGVFRQRQEDDMDVVRPALLPPVRIKSAPIASPSWLPPHTPTTEKQKLYLPMPHVPPGLMAPPTRVPPDPTGNNISTASQPAIGVSPVPSVKSFDQPQYTNESVPQSSTNELRRSPSSRVRCVRSNGAERSEPARSISMEHRQAMPEQPISPIAEFEALSLASMSGLSSGSALSPAVPTQDLNCSTDSFSYEQVHGQGTKMAESPSATSGSGESETISWPNIELNADIHNAKEGPHQCGALLLETQAEQATQLSSFPAPPVIEFQLKPDPNDATKITWTVQRPNSFVRNDEKLWQYLEEQTTPISNENPLWLTMERDIGEEFATNVAAEFDKIRHSYEINEADFLELRENIKEIHYTSSSSGQASIASPTEPKGFGRNIDEDWDNFANLEAVRPTVTVTTTTTQFHTVAESAQGTTEITYKTVESNATEGQVEIQSVKCNMPDCREDEDKDEIRERQTARNFRTEYNSGHLTNKVYGHVEELDDDSGDETDEEEVKVTYKRRLNFKLNINDNDDLDDDGYKTQHPRLKQRRPTGYIQSVVGNEELPTTNENSDDQASEIDVCAQNKVVELVKKVTFDTHTEEHYLPADHWREYVNEQASSISSTSSSDDDVAYNTIRLNSEIDKFALKTDDSLDSMGAIYQPRPIQRLARTHQFCTATSAATFAEQERTTALLFSSQISMDTDDDDLTKASDSWRAIRHLRHERENIRQLHSLFVNPYDDDDGLPPPRDPPPPPPPSSPPVQQATPVPAQRSNTQR